MPYSINPIKPKVFHIGDPMGVYMTVIIGDEKALVFDTGYGIERFDAAISSITDLPLIVVNSHGHFDHISGNRFFPEVYLHSADLSLYQDHASRKRRQAVLDMLKDQPDLIPAGFSPEEYLAPFKTKILPINEGDIFDLGGVQMTVIHAPGHTHGGIALLDDRDRFLLTGDAASPHVWMFLPESTTISTYIQSMKRLQELAPKYDGVVASHVPHILPIDIIDRLIHCAENIDPETSVQFNPPFNDLSKALMYFEGLESLEDSLGMETLDFEKNPFHTLDLDGLDFSKISFVSIVYNESKL